jgi:uncharacterized membrane protein
MLGWSVALIFVAAGANHFFSPEFYCKMMPRGLPYPLYLVYVSGILEIFLGIGFCYQPYRKIFAYGIIVLLIAIFPANIFMAQNYELWPNIPVWFHWVRLPLQFVLIALVWWLRDWK